MYIPKRLYHIYTKKKSTKFNKKVIYKVNKKIFLKKLKLTIDNVFRLLYNSGAR